MDSEKTVTHTEETKVETNTKETPQPQAPVENISANGDKAANDKKD